MTASLSQIGWTAWAQGWLTVARVQTAAVTGAAPLWGALVVEPDLAGWQIIALFCLGVMAHIYGFMLNEVVDLNLDAATPQLAGKPLVSGAVSQRSALIGALVQPVLAVILTLVLFGADGWMLAVLLLSIALATGYDLWGKRCPLPPLADAALGASVGLLVVYGALAASHWAGTGNISPAVFSTALALTALSALQITFNNGVEGGLKDLENDLTGGAATTALWFGARVQVGRLIAPVRFRAYAWALKGAAMVVGIAALLACRSGASCAAGESGVWLVAALLMALGMGLTLRRFMRDRLPYDRAWLKRAFSIHEFVTYTFAATIAGPLVGVGWAASLVSLPIVWFLLSNFILYGSPLEPRV